MEQGAPKTGAAAFIVEVEQAMVETPPQNRSVELRRALTGAALVLIGVVLLATLIFLSNSRAPAAEHAMFRLGLAGSALLSAAAQAMILLGGWKLWLAARRRRPG